MPVCPTLKRAEQRRRRWWRRRGRTPQCSQSCRLLAPSTARSKSPAVLGPGVGGVTQTRTTQADKERARTGGAREVGGNEWSRAEGHCLPTAQCSHERLHGPVYAGTTHQAAGKTHNRSGPTGSEGKVVTVHALTNCSRPRRWFRAWAKDPAAHKSTAVARAFTHSSRVWRAGVCACAGVLWVPGSSRGRCVCVRATGSVVVRKLRGNPSTADATRHKAKTCWQRAETKPRAGQANRLYVAFFLGCRH